MLRRRPLLTLALPMLLTVVLPGCGGSDSSNGDLKKDALQSDISQRLAQATGGQAPQVVCPSDLPAKVGATIRCRVAVSNTSYGVTVTVKSTTGGSAQYDVQVDAQ